MDPEACACLSSTCPSYHLVNPLGECETPTRRWLFVVVPSVVVYGLFWCSTSDSWMSFMKPIRARPQPPFVPASQRPSYTSLRAAIVTQIWPPPPADAPAVVIVEPPSGIPEAAGVAVPLPGDAGITAEAGVSQSAAQSAVVQYDFGNAATMRNQGFDKSAYGPLFTGAIVLLALGSLVVYTILSKNATKLGVELNPRRARDDFTANYRPRPVKPITPVDIKLENQLKDEIRRRGLQDEMKKRGLDDQ